MKTQDSENTVNSTLIILDNIKQWLPYYETDSVITAIDYLRNDGFSHHSHLVINLCSDFSYHSEGYYCSLLAQARKHKVIPSIDTLNKLGNKTSFRADNSLMQLCRCNAQLSVNQQTQLLDLDLYFGKSEDPQFERLARYIFDQYPTPLLRASFSNKEPYQIINIRPLALQELDDHQQDLFAHNLDRFNRKVWRQPRSKKSTRYDLAIFHDPGETFPPSNKTALNLFLS